MGANIAPHENYVASLFEPFNLRFGPAQSPDAQRIASGEQPALWQFGGIPEVVALQKQFGIFRKGRRFIESAALLGLTGFVSGPAKDRWVTYLSNLPTFQTDVSGVNADEHLVANLIENLEGDSPLPCHMRPHDGRRVPPGLLVITREPAVFYLESHTFLTISVPMRPGSAAPAAR